MTDYNKGHRRRPPLSLGESSYYPPDEPELYTESIQRKKQSFYQAYKAKQRRQNRFFMLSAGLVLTLAVSSFIAVNLFQTVSASVISFMNPTPKELQLNKLMSEVTTPKLNSLSEILWVNKLFPTQLNDDSLMPVPLAKENKALKSQVSSHLATYPDVFSSHLYFYDLETGDYFNINGDEPVAAASVIKLPVLYEFYKAVDKGWLAEDYPIYYLDYHRSGGAGYLQFKDADKLLPAYEVAQQMIQISDNTCTNLIIETLGGEDALNQAFEKSGLYSTRIANWLPDLDGTNMISAKDMTTLLYNVETGNQLSDYAKSRMLGILRGTHNKRLLPAQLPRDTIIAHKTGDIGTVLGDAGLFTLPNGKKYILVAQVERPFNNYTARDMIQDASKIVYDYMVEQSELNATGGLANAE